MKCVFTAKRAVRLVAEVATVVDSITTFDIRYAESLKTSKRTIYKRVTSAVPFITSVCTIGTSIASFLGTHTFTDITVKVNINTTDTVRFISVVTAVVFAVASISESHTPAIVAPECRTCTRCAICFVAAVYTVDDSIAS